MKLFSFLKNKKKTTRTLEEYLQIAKKEPDNPGIHMKIADLHMKKGDKDKAITEYIYAAEGYSKEELYQLAMSIYKTVLSIDLTLVPVYITLAELYERQGFIGDAAVTFERLAQYYLKEGKFQEVKDVVDKMTNLDPENHFIQKRAQRFLSTVSDTAADQTTVEEELLTIEQQGAGEGFQAAVPEHPIEGKGFFDLGALLDDGVEFIPSEDAMRGHNSSSMEVDAVFEGIRRNIDDSSEEESYRLHYELGVAYQQMERFDEAIKELKMALGEADIKNQCFIRLCTCFREKEMYKHAVNAAKSGLKSRFISQAEYLGLHYELGLTYVQMEEHKKALESFVEIAKVDASYKDTRQIIEEMKGQI